MDLDEELDNLITTIKTEAVGQWIIEPIENLVSEGISQDKLLQLIHEETGETKYQEVYEILNPVKTLEEPEGFGGILILAIILLCTTAIISAWRLYVEIMTTFPTGVWEAITTQGGEMYHPVWAPFMIGKFAVTSVIVLAPIPLLILMVKKLKQFPRMMIAYYLFYLIIVLIEFSVIEFVIVKAFPSIEKGLMKQIYPDLMRSMLYALLWIPYFLKSERVRKTFIN